MSKKMQLFASIVESWLSKVSSKQPSVVVYTAKKQREFLHDLGQAQLRHAINQWPPLDPK